MEYFFTIMLYNFNYKLIVELKPYMSEFMNDDETVELTSSASESALRLQAHPNISARILSLLDLVEYPENNC